MSTLTHLNENGEANMVDISAKVDTFRQAQAQAIVELTPQITAQIDHLEKGDLFGVARVAGIQGAKKCSELIPLCHALPLSKVTLEFVMQANTLTITSTCNTYGKTGVEMEALTAVSISALTIYDMCKGVDKSIEIKQIKLLSKSGGKSGDWQC